MTTTTRRIGTRLTDADGVLVHEEGHSALGRRLVPQVTELVEDAA